MDSVYGQGNLNFKEPPFDLGSFDEIAFQSNGRGTHAVAFGAGFCADEDFYASFEFKEYQTLPVQTSMHLLNGDNWIEYSNEDGDLRIKIGTSRGSWTAKQEIIQPNHQIPIMISRQQCLYGIHAVLYNAHKTNLARFVPLNGSPSFSQIDVKSILGTNFMSMNFGEQRPFVSAPVQSKPQRTYDQGNWTPDPEGVYVPMFLSNLENYDTERWNHLKSELERFGSSAGLFDEIEIRRLGKTGSSPFQIQVRKFGKRRKGPKQNLIDVGYGVSQILPILTELLLSENNRMVLLQQPEIHLHPSVQASLGSLLCEIASKGRQLIIEAHSEFLIDRIRMDVRDETTNLKPEDVSILFFERNDTEVQIHPIRIDGLGNVLNAPPSYGTFFMEEKSRSLGF
ncbi:MAG: AAA family ATPase [Bacteroidetes bacterium]|nr:AAA family ATPase [Bacteroidota bacterium]